MKIIKKSLANQMGIFSKLDLELNLLEKKLQQIYSTTAENRFEIFLFPVKIKPHSNQKKID